jgi:hypothetical protein
VRLETLDAVRNLRSLRRRATDRTSTIDGFDLSVGAVVPNAQYEPTGSVKTRIDIGDVATMNCDTDCDVTREKAGDLSRATVMDAG